jgi:uncharacterized membrane protein YphA (DoxX/SURF4 family)
MQAYEGIWLEKPWPLADFLLSKGLSLGQGKAFAGTLVVLICLGIPALCLGLFTRLSAAILLGLALLATIFTFGDATSSAEPPLLYSLLCLAIFLNGPGRMSLDTFFTRKR